MLSLSSSLTVLSALLQVSSGANLYAHKRADVWRSDLPESGTSDPKTGRRYHIVVDGVSVAEQDLGSVTVNGQDCLALSDDLTYFDWCRAHSNPGTGQVWISFHSRNTDWDSSSDLDVRVSAKDGSSLAEGSVAVAFGGSQQPSLSYVATRHGGSQALLHLHGSGAVDRVLFDGREVPLPSWASSLPADGHAVLVVDGLSKRPGDAWTAAVFSGGSVDGYGGRTLHERFPIEAWPTSSDCPLPGAKDGNAQVLKDLGIDSVFYEAGKLTKYCDAASKDEFYSLVENLPNVEDGWFHLLADGEKKDLEHLSAAARSRVDAVLVGDESDDKVDAEHIHPKLQMALDWIKKFPEVPVYIGSKTTRNVGAFAGITDIQGSDAYCAACAPTMLAVTHTLPLQYPYYYLRNARDNHAPLPFWGYSQLYSEAWSYQANSNEIVAQIAQVVLSGSKAIMFFQSNAGMIDDHDASTLKQALWSIRHVSDIIREGDIMGLPFTVSSKLNKEVMAETILSPEKLLVTVVNTDASGYSNTFCHIGTSKHWSFKSHTLKTMTLDTSAAPGVARLTNWQEATKDGFVPLSDVSVQGESDQVVLSNIDLDDKLVARFFVADVVSAGGSEELTV